MAETVDRRAAERYAVNGDAQCPFVSPVVEEFGPVKVKDVSMAGVGLIVKRRIEPGTLLAVTLSSPSKGFTKTVLVRTTHATSMLSGGFLVGGNFDVPLTYQEMSALVL